MTKKEIMKKEPVKRREQAAFSSIEEVCWQVTKEVDKFGKTPWQLKFGHSLIKQGESRKVMHNVYIVQIFSSRPNEVRHIFKSYYCHSFNIYLSQCVRLVVLCPDTSVNTRDSIIPLYQPQGNPILPCSCYRAFFTTGEYDCSMYTLCSAGIFLKYE